MAFPETGVQSLKSLTVKLLRVWQAAAASSSAIWALDKAALPSSSVRAAANGATQATVAITVGRSILTKGETEVYGEEGWG